MESYNWIDSVMRRSLREKLASYDESKARWDALVKKGESSMSKNGEQAEAYFFAALDMEDELTCKITELYRLRDAILRKEKGIK